MIFNISNQKFNIKKSDLDNKVSKNDLFNEEGQLTTDAIALGEGVKLYNGDTGYLLIDCETLAFNTNETIELATSGTINITGDAGIGLSNENSDFYFNENGLGLRLSNVLKTIDLFAYIDLDNENAVVSSANSDLTIFSDRNLVIDATDKITLAVAATLVNILPTDFEVETRQITLSANDGIDITGPNGTLKFSDDETDFTYNGNKIYHEGNKPTAADIGALDRGSFSEQMLPPEGANWTDKIWNGDILYFNKYPNNDYDIEIFPSGNGTKESLEQWNSALFASLIEGYTVNGLTYNAIKCFGDKPTIILNTYWKITKKTGVGA